MNTRDKKHISFNKTTGDRSTCICRYGEKPWKWIEAIVMTKVYCK